MVIVFYKQFPEMLCLLVGLTSCHCLLCFHDGIYIILWCFLEIGQGYELSGCLVNL